METAKIILQQLGGQKFIVTTGSYNFAGDGSSLQMKLRRNKLSASYLRIKLTVWDTYDMTFINSKGKAIKTVSGVYSDMLQDIFTRETGLYTHL
jgi:hypothetical protein